MATSAPRPRSTRISVPRAYKLSPRLRFRLRTCARSSSHARARSRSATSCCNGGACSFPLAPPPAASPPRPPRQQLPLALRITPQPINKGLHAPPHRSPLHRPVRRRIGLLQPVPRLPIVLRPIPRLRAPAPFVRQRRNQPRLIPHPTHGQPRIALQSPIKIARPLRP